MAFPALYTRFGKHGMPCDEKPSRSVNISRGGVRLQSSFSVEPREALDIAMAVQNSVVSFKGEVVYVIGVGDQTFELGISIREMDDGERLVLKRSTEGPHGALEQEDERVIIAMGKIFCPHCGEHIASLDKIRAMRAYCKGFLSRCHCGLLYEIRVSSYGPASLSFLGEQIELVC